MSAALTLARPYARAAFALAREQGRLQAWSDQIGFAATVASDASARALLNSPSMSADAAVILLSPEADLDPDFAQFLRVLESNGRLPLLPEIAQIFEQARAEAEGVVNVRITSATELDAAEVEAISVALRRRFGSDIALSREVDPELIGGAVIQAGDVTIDGSLRTKLAHLRSTLAQ